MEQAETIEVETTVAPNATCCFCKEEVEYSLPAPGVLGVMFDRGASCRPAWRHITTGWTACNTVATPLL